MSDDTPTPPPAHRFENCIGVNPPPAGAMFVPTFAQSPRTWVFNCIGHVDPETGHLVMDEMRLRETRE